jgi:hypothetical protein
VVDSNWDGGDHAERSSRLVQIAGLLRDIDADVSDFSQLEFAMEFFAVPKSICGFLTWRPKRSASTGRRHIAAFDHTASLLKSLDLAEVREIRN